MNRTTAYRCLILLAALTLTAVMVGINGCAGEETPSEEVIRPVRTQLVYAAGGERNRSFSGTARAGVESNLSFKVPGLVMEIPVTLGQQVKRGGLIAQLEPTDYELQVQDTQALLAQARSQARNAGANYDRMQALYENNNASRSDLDTALAGKESADAQVSSIEKKLELARLQLDYTRLTAPFDGSVASVDIQQNENVRAGQTIIMLTGVESIEVEVSIPSMLISSVREGSPVSATFDALPGERFEAIVTEVATASAGLATTYPVKVRLNDKTDRVRPGMAAEVTFTFTSTNRAEFFLVPAVAVAEDHHGRFMYIVEESDDGHWVARRREVVTGELTRLGLEISSGIEDGERIVTAGVSRITDGQKVRLTGEDAGR